MKFSTISLLCLVFSSLFGGDFYIFTHPGGDRGFFNVMDILFGNVARLDMRKHDGATVDLKENGYNYEPERGPNYWNYYFEPLEIGERKPTSRVKEIVNLGARYYYWYLEEHLNRMQVHEMIEKHLVVLPHVLEKLVPYEEQFATVDHVLGVHYRGTDRMTKKRRKQAADKMMEHIETFLSAWEGSYLIFLATDEEQFLERVKEAYPGKVVYLEDAERSSNHWSFHQHPKSPYQSGEDALVDCLLLSKTDLLIRTESCLSRWSSYFNPTMPVYHMFKRKFE